MADYKVTDTELTSIANAIRTKGGTSNRLVFPTEFVSAINSIPTGGGGSTNILHGTSLPTASVGNNGDIYLRTALAGVKNGARGQFVNTGYHGNSNSEYHIIFKSNAVQTDTYPSPFGARSASSALENCTYCQIGYKGNYHKSYCSWASSEYNAFNIGMADMLGEIIDIELKAGYFSMSVGLNNYQYTFTPGSISDTTPVGIFAMLVNGNTIITGMMNDMVLYEFEIRENSQLVHRFVPAKDGNDIVCVYDEIDQEYKYPNTGTLEYVDAVEIIADYCKVDGIWQPLIGTDINDVNLGGN